VATTATDVRTRTAVPLGAATLGAAAVAYAAGYEVRAFTTRFVEVPVLPVGASPLRLLHLSDLHLVPTQRLKREWLRSLAALEPDFVVNTGDNLAHLEAVPAVLDALGPLLQRPGAFVFGSNDYFGPKPKNPARYLLRHGGRKRIQGVRLPWQDLQAGLRTAGWLDLNNARAEVMVGGTCLQLAGTDDPHIGRDRYGDLPPAPAPTAGAVPIGVTHAPYRRVLDAMAADQLPLILAGHTHGGQLCVPGIGALVTNCDLPRRQARGLSRWGESWLHVSAGAGTSPYTPVRFACRPEATLLTLLPRG
jgi:predicted MPP superfamily phosphohydrolase